MIADNDAIEMDKLFDIVRPLIVKYIAECESVD